jgi:hypothetical protein
VVALAFENSSDKYPEPATEGGPSEKVYLKICNKTPPVVLAKWI